MVGEVYDVDGAYNCIYNNTAWLSYTCVDSFPLTATFEKMDSKNGTWYIPNKKLISEVITRLESPIELKKKKAYFEQRVIKRDKSFHWEKDTPRFLIRERKRWTKRESERSNYNWENKKQMVVNPRCLIRDRKLWTKKKESERCSYDRENKKQIVDKIYTWQNVFFYIWRCIANHWSQTNELNPLAALRNEDLIKIGYVIITLSRLTI